MPVSTPTVSANTPLKTSSSRWLSRSARLLSLSLAGTILAACTGADFRTDYQVSRDRAAAYLAANPGLGAEKEAAIRQATLVAGMTKQDVVAAWGRPVIVRNYRSGTQEYWLFGCHWPHICTDSDEDNLFPAPEDIFNSHALFESGRLVSWHG